MSLSPRTRPAPGMIVAAVLVRFYAYPTLATVPASYDGVTELESSGAQIFNSDPEVLANQAEFRKLSKEHNGLAEHYALIVLLTLGP